MHQRFGWLNLQGTILSRPAQYQREVVIARCPLTTVSIPTLVTEGQGPIEYFSIRLTDCTLISQKGKKRIIPRFIATFDGPSNGNGNFELSGEVKVLHLAIADRYGSRQAVPGQLPPVGIDSQSMAFAVPSSNSQKQRYAKSGNYRTTLRFSWNTIKWIRGLG